MSKSVAKDSIVFLNCQNNVINENELKKNENRDCTINDFLQFVINNNKLLIYKLLSSTDKSNVQLLIIEKQISELDPLITNFQSNKSHYQSNSDNKDSLINHISQLEIAYVVLKTNLQYLKKLLPESVNFNNINGIEVLCANVFDKIPNLFTEDNLNIQKIDEAIKDIKLLNEIFSQIINITNSIKSCHYKIIKILHQLTKLINDLRSNNISINSIKNINSASIKLEYIDENEEPVISIQNSEIKYPKNTQYIIRMYTNFIKQYKQQIIESIPIFQNEEQTESNKQMNDLIDFFRHEYFDFIDDFLNKCISQKNSNSDLLEFLNSILAEFKILPEQTQNELNQQQPENLFYITKNDFHLKGSSVLSAANQIFQHYSIYLSKEQENELYDEFISAFIDEISNPMEKTAADIIDELRQQGKYFCYDVFFHLFNKKLLDQKLIHTDYVDTFELKDKVLLDSRMLFYSKVDDELTPKKKKILTQICSKFVIYSNENNNNMEIPFFPLGSLYSIHNAKKNKFSLVDKIVLILEIGTALKDLHEKNKYHGCLCSKFVFISASKNAYLDAYHDRKLETKLSKKAEAYYYRSPEVMKIMENYVINDKNKNNGEEEEKEEKINIEKLADIYSFGVLIYEIITEIMPPSLLKNSASNIVTSQMQNYADFLFKQDNTNYFKDDFIDLSGNSTKGIKEIIEKCVKNNSQDRFSSFTELIETIKMLPIYLMNKDEIEYRISKATSSFEYKCTLSEIIESYFRGYTSIISLIKMSLNIDSINVKKEKFNENNIVESIFKSIKIGTTPNNLWIKNFNRTNNGLILKGKSIYNSLLLLNQPYLKYIFSEVIKSSYDEFLQVLDENTYKLMAINGSIDKKLIHIFSSIQKQDLLFYFNTFYHIFLKNILDSNLFISKLQVILNEYPAIEDLTEVYDSLHFNEINSSFKLHFDKNLNFYNQKTYNANVQSYVSKREKEILNQKLSKFIVQIYKQNDQDNSIFIPYFPIGPLDSLFYIQKNDKKPEKRSQVKLTLVDKLVFILEISEAMKDLHSHYLYHGNLSSQFIYISSTKDAYLSAFCYDRKLEGEATKPRGPFYYRSPEIFKKIEEIKKEEEENNNNNNNDNDNEDSNIINDNDIGDDSQKMHERQMSDIFSAGVLMHEIITETIPESRMGNRPREQRLSKLKGDYGSFLFEGTKNQYFDDPSMKGMKDIIFKCMSQNINDRYQSFKELIESIQTLEIYKKNKKEIDYRISHAVHSSELKCTLSDIVESFFLGQLKSYETIQNIITKYLSIKYQEEDSDSKIIDIPDDIIKMLYDNFEINLNRDVTYIFEDFFKIIISQHFKEKVIANSNPCCQNKMFSLSMQANVNKKITSKLTNVIYQPENIEYITPIMTLDQFIQNTNYNISHLIYIWGYIIAKELLFIHSIDLYHGDLDPKTIGIYYNKAAKTFVPSFILFYAISKISRNSTKSTNRLVDLNYYSKDDIIMKYQQKDIKNMIKIFQKLPNTPQEFLKLFTGTSSINVIFFRLSNYIRKQENEMFQIIEKKFNINSYSDYQITFSSLKDIITFSISNKYSMDSFFIDIPDILENINTFVINLSNNPSLSLAINMAPDPNKPETQSSLYNLLDQIRSNSFTALETLEALAASDSNDEHHSFVPYSTQTFKKPIPFSLENFSSQRKEVSLSKAETKSKKKEVFRYIELFGFTKQSAGFLIRRYIFNLSPFFKFRLTLKLNNNKSAAPDSDKIDLNDVKRITKNIKRLAGEPYPYEENIGIHIDVDTSYIDSLLNQ